MIRIQLNGEPREVRARSLAELLEECAMNATPVATALNREFVPLDLREETPLRDGDRVEVLAPMQGG